MNTIKIDTIKYQDTTEITMDKVLLSHYVYNITDTNVVNHYGKNLINKSKQEVSESINLNETKIVRNILVDKPKCMNIYKTERLF